MQAEDIDFATEWSAQALKLMADHGVPPCPDNYAVWFRYVSGRCPELTQEIDERIRDNRPIDLDVTLDLQRRYFSDEKLTDVTLTTGTRLNTEVDQLLRIIEESVGNSTALGASVRAASAGLSSGSSPSDVLKAVEAIVTASRKMEERSAELEEHLHATKKELNELQQNLEKAHTEARTDGLTGINNRKAFDEAIDREIKAAHENSKPLCLIVGDIDHFKKFNDTFGHRTGDQVLRLVATCLKNGASAHHIVARYGGEEFLIVLPHSTSKGASEQAQRLCEHVRSLRIKSGEHEIAVTVSIGIAQYQVHKEDWQSLLKRADEALYQVKRSGRDGWAVGQPQ